MKELRAASYISRKPAGRLATALDKEKSHMELPSYFLDFLRDIRPTSAQLDDYKSGHKLLRERLQAYQQLSRIIVTTFLQGSYRRATAIRPHEGKRADVDVILVTKLHQNEYTPAQAFELFLPFLDKYYKGKYEPNGRSFGIHLSYVDLDLVITAAPSQSEMGILLSESVTTDETPEDVNDWKLVKSWVPSVKRTDPGAWRLMEAARQEPEWKTSPLLIPDRDAQRWEPTHPLAQIQRTWEKNRQCDGHYVNVVKAIKWWRRINHPTPTYPKGYPVEHLIWHCCPSGISSVAEGVTRTLETIAYRYQGDASLENTPYLPDHGVPEHNVFRRVSGEDFAAFHAQVSNVAKIAREAFNSQKRRESVEGWRKLFGDKFPPPPDDGDDDDGDNGPKQGGYTPRTTRTQVSGGGRFGR
jgi:hypothetical protein